MRRAVLGILCLAISGATFWAAPSLAGEESVTEAKIGHQAPAFSLKDVDGKEFDLTAVLKDGKTKAVVLEWFNPQCPVCKGCYRDGTITDLVKSFEPKNVKFVGINSTHSLDAATTKDLIKSWDKLNYPILMDTPGTVGKLYGAKTTPHLFIINSEGILVYNGAIDNKKAADEEGYVNHVKQALDQVLAGETVAVSKTKSYGCSVKYKK